MDEGNVLHCPILNTCLLESESLEGWPSSLQWPLLKRSYVIGVQNGTDITFLPLYVEHEGVYLLADHPWTASVVYVCFYVQPGSERFAG